MKLIWRKKFVKLTIFSVSGVAMVHLKSIAKSFAESFAKSFAESFANSFAKSASWNKSVILTEKFKFRQFDGKKQGLHWKFHKNSLFSKLYRNTLMLIKVNLVKKSVSHLILKGLHTTPHKSQSHHHMCLREHCMSHVQGWWGFDWVCAIPQGR